MLKSKFGLDGVCASGVENGINCARATDAVLDPGNPPSKGLAPAVEVELFTVCAGRGGGTDDSVDSAVSEEEELEKFAVSTVVEVVLDPGALSSKGLARAVEVEMLAVCAGGGGGTDDSVDSAASEEELAKSTIVEVAPTAVEVASPTEVVGVGSSDVDVGT